MKSKYLNSIIAAATLFMVSCEKDLNLTPTNEVTADEVYSSIDGYRQAFAKVYGSYALTGNQGPSDKPDVQGLDEGSNADFLRSFWLMQEFTTDEAVCNWGDPGVPDLHRMEWSSNNPFLTGLYYRSIYQITLCNEFMRESTDSKLSSRGITGKDADEVRQFIPEARFLRAYQYWVLMDLFGNPPFVTENDPVGGPLPKQIKRADLFNYVESELKAIEGALKEPATNEYGRADRAACWALLARLYLNAEVYTGTQRYTDAVTYSDKVITSNKFSLIADYTKLMRADNDKHNRSEFILTINYDGTRTRLWGGTTFLVCAPLGGSMPARDFGVSSGWGGVRTTKALVNLFTDSKDQRAQFYTSGQSLEINDITKFQEGYAITKFKNVKYDGTAGSDPTYSDVDMPIFRFAEMYLVYAEAVLRGGGGDKSKALDYINKLKDRANATRIGQGELTVDFILDERARELYWEGFRRTDLIRYNKFVESSYLWPWKGGMKDGTSVDPKYKIFPIPSADQMANPNLTQNPGY